MQIKLPLLVSAIASALSFNAQSTPTTIASGNNLKIVAEDVFQYGQLFGSDMVATTDTRVIHANSKGYVVTTDVGSNGKLSVTATQKLPFSGDAKFVLSSDGQMLIYVVNNDSKVFITQWNQSSSQWDTPAEHKPHTPITDLHSVNYVDDKILSIGFADTLQFYLLPIDSADTLRYLNDSPTPRAVKVHPIKNSPENQRQYFVEIAQENANGVVGSVVKFDEFFGGATNLATLTLHPDDFRLLDHGRFRAYVDGKNLVVALADTFGSQGAVFYQFNGTDSFEKLSTSTLPKLTVGLFAYEDGILVLRGQRETAEVYSASVENGVMVYHEMGKPDMELSHNNIAIGEQRIFSNFLYHPVIPEFVKLSEATIDRTAKTVTAENNYVNGELETKFFSENDYYKASSDTQNHWMIYKDKDQAELLSVANPQQSLATISYDIIPKLGPIDRSIVGLTHFELGESLYVFQEATSRFYPYNNGKYQRTYINDAGELASDLNYLSGAINTQSFLTVNAYPIPSLNGIAILDPSRILFYRQLSDGPLTLVASIDGDFSYTPKVWNNTATLVDDGRGILFINNRSGVIKRVLLDGSTLSEEAVSFDVTPPAGSLKNAVSYGRYVSFYPSDNSPLDVHTYRRNDAGDFELYFTGDVPCECVFNDKRRLTDTQAFDVKDGQLRYYELNTVTKAWSLVETLSFPEDFDTHGLNAETYYGKSDSAVRRYLFSVKPGLVNGSAYTYEVGVEKTFTVDVSTYFSDVNTNETHTYVLSNAPDYATLTGSTLQVRPTLQSNDPSSFTVQVRDAAGFEREVTVSIAISSAPVSVNQPPKIVEKDTPVIGTLQDNVKAGHSSGSSLTFSSAGDSALPVSANGSYSGSFSSYGTFRIKATAADDQQRTAQVEQTVIVNSKPVARTLERHVVEQGTVYSGALDMGVTDDDGDTLTWETASNSVLPVSSNSRFSGVLNNFGETFVGAIATDEVGQSVTVIRPVLVNAKPTEVTRSAIRTTPNTTLAGSLRENVSDVDGTTFTFLAKSDSDLPVSANGDYTGAFASAGTYWVKAQVTDEHGASVNVKQRIIVDGVPVFNAPAPLWVNPLQGIQGNFSSMIVDPEGQAITFSSAAGSALPVAIDGSFGGSLANAGRHEIKATATDSAGNSVDVVQVVHVNAIPVAQRINDILVNPSDPISVNIAAAFSDADNHALTYTVSNLPQGVSFSRDGMLTGSISSEGNYDMSFTATDTMNLAAVLNLTIRVTKSQPNTRPETTQWRGKNVLITGTTLHQDGIYEGTETVAVGANRILNFEGTSRNPYFGQAITSEINADGSISAVGGQSLPNLTSAKPRLFNNGNTLAYIGYVQAEFRNALYISNWNGATKRWDEPSWMIIDGLQRGRVDDFQLDIQGDTVALAIGDSTNFSVSVYTRDTQSNALTLVNQVPSSEVGKQVAGLTLLPNNNQLMVTLASSKGDTDTTQARLYSIDKQAKTITHNARVQLSDEEQSFAHVATTKHWFDAVTNTYFYYAPQSTLTDKFVAYRLNTEGTAYERLANSVFPDYLIEIVGVKDGIFVGRHSTNDTRAFTLSTDSGLSFRRMAEVPYEFGKALTDGLVGDSWGMVRSSYGSTVYTINKDQSRIRFKKRYGKGQVGAPQLGEDDEFVSLFRAKNRVMHLKDSKELVQLNNDEAATSHIRFSYDLNGFSSTTVPVEFQELGGYFYSLYNGVSYGTTVSVSYMKIYADSNGNLTRRVEYLRDNDGEIVNLNVFKFYPAPSMGGMILHTADKMTFYKQQINGNLVYESELTGDFPLRFGEQQLLDDGRGITYWDRNVRRLDRLILDEHQQLKLIKAPYRIATPGTPAYADNGRLNFLFYIGGTPRTNMYVLNEAGIYERKFVGRAPCDCVVKAETLFTPNRGYGFVKGDSVVSIYDLNPSTYEWTTSDTIPFSESIEHFDKDTKTAYGRIGSWLRQYTFQSAPALTKTPETIVLAQGESRTIDLSSYFHDADDNEQHTITIDNLPQGATLNGTQLTLTGSSAINGMKLTVKVTDLQDFVLTFELPISVNPAVEVNTAADTEQTVALRNKPTVLPLEPQLSSIGSRFSGSLAEGVIDADGGNLVFSTAEGSDFAIQADGSYTDEVYGGGNYTASAMVTDQYGQTVTVSQRVIVNAAPDVDAMPELVFEAGENISGSLADAISDANGDVLIFTSAADSALPVAANGEFTGVLSAGSYQLKGTVSDIHGEVVEYVQHIHVVAKSGKTNAENANASNTNTSGSLNNSASLTSSSSQRSSSGGLLWLVGLLPFVKRGRNKKLN